MLVLNGYTVDIPCGDDPLQISIFRVNDDRPGGRGNLMIQQLHQPSGMKTGMYFDMPFIGGEYGFEISGPCTLVPKYVSVQQETP